MTKSEQLFFVKSQKRDFLILNGSKQSAYDAHILIQVTLITKPDGTELHFLLSTSNKYRCTIKINFCFRQLYQYYHQHALNFRLGDTCLCITFLISTYVFSNSFLQYYSDPQQYIRNIMKFGY